MGSEMCIRDRFSPSLEWLLALTEEEFRELFRKSPVKRAKQHGLLRNVCVAIGNSGLRPGEPRYAEICARLAQLATGNDVSLAEHARWALNRLGVFYGSPQDPPLRVVPPPCQG